MTSENQKLEEEFEIKLNTTDGQAALKEMFLYQQDLKQSVDIEELRNALYAIQDIERLDGILEQLCTATPILLAAQNLFVLLRKWDD